MTTHPWHAGPELLEAYADGRLDDVGLAAVETHLTRCPACRADATDLVPRADLDPVWEGIAVGLATGEGAPTRLLRRLGVRDTDIVVLRASADLVVPFAIALATAVCFATLGGFLRPDLQQSLALLVAPLLPALMVAGAYDATDPLRELTEATAASKLRVALLRTSLAALSALPLTVLVGLVPQVGGIGLWLLPAVAVSTTTLALLTRFEAPVSLGVVTVAWLLVVGTLRATGSTPDVTSALGQVSFAVATVVAATVLVHRLGVRVLVLGAAR